ncbi:MAG TPA: putative S-layer protein [Candidatus Nanoarchaeia archaeon]|nr:putative S-layer protein [Candidatus Nanoarchaeia archaeon]
MIGNQKNKIGALIVMIIAVIAFSGLALADDFVPDQQNPGPQLALDVLWVKIDGNTVQDNAVISEDVKRGETLDISVKTQANADVEDITVSAQIFGDEHNALDDKSETFDVVNQTRYTTELSLRLPDNMQQDYYDLRVIVADRNSALKVYNYNLKIDTKRHAIVIKDLTLNPANEVVAGRALLATVRVRNMGEKDEDSVKVSVEIPGLNQYVSDYVDDLESEDSASSEEMYLRVPQNAKNGEYEGKVVVTYDDETKDVIKTFTVKVVGGEETQAGTSTDSTTVPVTTPKTTIVIGPETQDTPRGQGGAIYPVTITNNGKESKSYTIEVSGVDSFGTVKVSPSTLTVVNSGATESVYIYVAASEEATAGQHTFTVKVKSGSDTLLTQPMTANVVEAEGAGSWESVKTALIVALIVLVVVLIVLAVLVAFKAMKKGGDDELSEEQTTAQTYY